MSVAVGTPTRVLASIHDVAPPHAMAVRHLWEMCRSAGFMPALFVVPNWHGESPLGESPRFVDWLRERAAEGAELFLHGERHDEVGTHRSLRDELRAVGRTKGEGEFLTLDCSAARSRIQRGMHYLQQLGLCPVGFVPPAWLAHRTTHDVVREMGLAYSEDVRHVFVHDHQRSAALTAPAVRWSGRTAVRARLSCGVAALHRLRTRRTPLIRLATHPQDLGNAATKRSVTGNIRYWATEGLPCRYAEVRR